MEKYTKQRSKSKLTQNPVCDVAKEKDELTKNHKGTDKEITAGIMPETLGSELCPVRSFEKYINKLHPSCHLATTKRRIR